MANADNKHPRRDTAPEDEPKQGGELPTKQLPREDEDEDESGSTGGDGESSTASAATPPERAIAPEGGVGRRSGTGQARAHRSFDDDAGSQMLGRAVDPDGELPEPGVGDSYQSGVRVKAWRDR
ncbi:hypothetical protein FHW84_004407 [Dyella sp. SG562]|uniref:hypothetical protein n=1 Tax=Dyella TaxID=231454 RepID=UPI001421F05C|nr:MULTISPECIES: hypothetical protein [unclassified Dyella]NII75796.1 hypothetical protein [Dyella sp. SG562]NKJ22124.1 hypothetical protein [Dyella sp. SG609]